MNTQSVVKFSSPTVTVAIIYIMINSRFSRLWIVIIYPLFIITILHKKYLLLKQDYKDRTVLHRLALLSSESKSENQRSSF